MKCEKCGKEVQEGRQITVTTETKEGPKYHFCCAPCAAEWLSPSRSTEEEWPQNEKEAKRLDTLVRGRDFDSWFLFKTHIRTHEVCHNAKSKHCEKCKEPECALQGWTKAMEEEEIMTEQAVRDQRIQDGNEK